MSTDPATGAQRPAGAPDPDDFDIPGSPGETRAANDGAPFDPFADARFKELESQVVELTAKATDFQSAYLRALAEAENIRKRAQRDVEMARDFGVERMARDLLSVADNLGRALAAAPRDLDALDAPTKNLIVGVQATERELMAAMERHGVSRIESLGKPMNADQHQAVAQVEDPTVPANTVIQEYAPGYLLKGRLLRAAMVVVSKGGPPAAATDSTAPAREAPQA
jgi:molecular chaperone GrpE